METSSQTSLDSEQRGGIRLPVPDHQQSVLLGDSRSSLRAMCVDQSAEGFGLCCDQKFPWAAGQILMMNKDGSWYEVQVRYVRPQEGGHRIGLQWLRDCDDFHVPGNGHLIREALWNLLGLRWLSNLQIFGLCSAFLLCLVVFVIVLNPELLSPSRLGSIGSAAESMDNPAVLPAQAISSASRAASRAATVAAPVDANTRADRSSPLLVTNKLNWLDVEQSLSLTVDQSRRLLLLLLGDVRENDVEQVESTRIVIEDHREFATYLSALPESSLDFLSEEQQRQLNAMVELLSQP